MNIRSRKDLLNFVNMGNSVEYIFFWGHQKSKSGISESCLSQWYESVFVVEGVTYKTAEHYMMARKAILFNDLNIFQKIIAAENPGEAKRLGREIRGFTEEKWIKHRFDIVVKGNIAKFTQNSDMGRFLANTGSKILVEASPVDKIWGIGVAAYDPAAENPNRWKGENLLGFALMQVRDQINSRSDV